MFRLFTEEKQLLPPTHVYVDTHIHSGTHCCHYTDVTAFINTDGTGHSEDARGGSVCFTELTAFTAMPPEATQPERFPSRLQTTGDLACGECSEATAQQEHLLPDHHLRQIQGSVSTPCWLNNKCNVMGESASPFFCWLESAARHSLWKCCKVSATETPRLR